MWLKLHLRYASTATNSKISVQTSLINAKHQRGADMSENINQFESTISRLTSMDTEVTASCVVIGVDIKCERTQRIYNCYKSIYGDYYLERCNSKFNWRILNGIKIRNIAGFVTNWGNSEFQEKWIQQEEILRMEQWWKISEISQKRKRIREKSHNRSDWKT